MMSELNTSLEILPIDLVDISPMADGSLRVTHKINYKIPQEIYSQWPKFYSIVLDSGNKQIVSLEFKNTPNLVSIRKVLSLFQAEFEHREVAQSNQQILRITTNGIPTLAYLYNIYYNISVQASEILESAIFHMTEDMMDRTVPTWKQDISIIIASLSDPDDDLDDDYDHNTSIICMTDDVDCLKRSHQTEELKDFKKEYRNYSLEAKEFLFKNITSAIVTEEVRKFIEQFDPALMKEMSYYEKYEKIEKVFDTPDKCGQYLYQKNENAKPCVEEMQSIIEQELLVLFTPTAFDQIKDALFSDKSLKHTKAAGTGVGATISLLMKLKVVTNTITPIFDVIDAIKVFGSAAYGLKEAGIISETEKKEINFQELSRSFSCKVTICSLNRFMNITPDSQKDLASFYAKFIYTAITKNPHPYPTESFLASNLLERLSNQTYVEKLELTKELATNLGMLDGAVISITDYIKDYNQTTCYEQVLHDLMGHVAQFMETEA